eukprot:1262182-Pyramimonas_sp.AAC.1
MRSRIKPERRSYENPLSSGPEGHDPREGCSRIGRRWAVGSAPQWARATIHVRVVPNSSVGRRSILLIGGPR